MFRSQLDARETYGTEANSIERMLGFVYFEGTRYPLILGKRKKKKRIDRFTIRCIILRGV